MDLIIPTSQPSKTNTKSSMVSLSFMPPKNRASIFKGLQHQNCQKTRSKPNTKIFNYNIEYKTKHFFILSLKNTLSNWKRSIQWLPTPPKKNTNFDQFTTHPFRHFNARMGQATIDLSWYPSLRATSPELLSSRWGLFQFSTRTA